MRDLLYLLITPAFFAVCVGLVRGCDRLVGPDDLDVDDVARLQAEPGSAVSETAGRERVTP